MDSVLAALKSDYIASVRLGDGVFQVALDGSDRLVGVYLGRRLIVLILLKAEGEAALAAVVAVFDDPARNGSRIGAFKHLFVQLIVKKPVEISPVCIAPMIFIKGVENKLTVVIPIRIRLEAAAEVTLRPLSQTLMPWNIRFLPNSSTKRIPSVKIVFIFISSAVYLLMLLDFFANEVVLYDLMRESSMGLLRTKCLAFLNQALPLNHKYIIIKA